MPERPSESGHLEVTWIGIAQVLKDEAWEGRWKPLEETNLGPLAGITADAIVKGYERRGLRLVAIPIEASGRTAREDV